MDLLTYLRSIPDFPKPGIVFYDISPLLENGPAWRYAIDEMARIIEPSEPDLLIGLESRGFLVASAVAYTLGCGFFMVRKSGKLPAEKLTYSYTLEYGEDKIEVHKNAVTPGQTVILLDDVLATGGTAAAALSLVRNMGAYIPLGVFLLELRFLHGRKKLDLPCESLMYIE